MGRTGRRLEVVVGVWSAVDEMRSMDMGEEFTGMIRKGVRGGAEWEWMGASN